VTALGMVSSSSRFIVTVLTVGVEEFWPRPDRLIEERAPCVLMETPPLHGPPEPGFASDARRDLRSAITAIGDRAAVVVRIRSPGTIIKRPETRPVAVLDGPLLVDMRGPRVLSRSRCAGATTGAIVIVVVTGVDRDRTCIEVLLRMVLPMASVSLPG